jgi:phosphatidylserine/phosphatidylglycerophosphate/cardiolipin synthase-like enzyme
MNDALLSLPANERHRLVRALDAGLLELPCSEAAVRSTLGAQVPAAAIAAGLSELAALGVSARGCAAMLRVVAEVEARHRKPDFVWSGPEVSGLHARDTRRVYEELFKGAERSVWVSTYAFFDGARAFAVLAERMDAVEGLEATLCLNIQRKHGDTTSSDDLVRRFADKFWSQDWPGKARPRVFFDPRSLDLGGPGGVLHAKAVVADGEAVFVTSANLTEAAWDRNIEIGLLVRDRSLAETLVCHFQGLVDKKLLCPLPAS